MKVITTNLLNRFWKNGIKPIKESVTGKLDSTKVINSLLTTVAGFALDARQGKVLDDKIAELNSKLSSPTYFNVTQGMSAAPILRQDCYCVGNRVHICAELQATTTFSDGLTRYFLVIPKAYRPSRNMDNVGMFAINGECRPLASILSGTEECAYVGQKYKSSIQNNDVLSFWVEYYI